MGLEETFSFEKKQRTARKGSEDDGGGSRLLGSLQYSKPRNPSVLQHVK